jgi:Protein of unknown function (DUF1194)
MRRLFAVALVWLALSCPAARAAEPVDLLLVLAADVSRSVNQRKFELQRQGYAAAIADRRVLEAISSGRNRRIAVLYMEWSGDLDTAIVIDWTMIDGLKAAQSFGENLLESPRSSTGRTAIGSGIDFAAAQFAHAPFIAERKTIDVSGDGTSNAGRDVTQARDEALARDITINGLVILSEHPLPWNPQHTNPPGGLANYYRSHVIGGPGSFVMEAKDFHSFGQAIIKKLVAEIADATPPAAAMHRP